MVYVVLKHWKDLLPIGYQFYLMIFEISDDSVHVPPSGLGALVHLCQGLGSLSGWRPC